MAADDLEYYQDFYTNYTHPFGVKGRISEDDAKKMDVYLIVRRDKENRIISIQDIHDRGNKCFFHSEYIYKENGDLLSYELIKNCKPYVFSPPDDIVTEHGNTSLEYYRSMRRTIVGGDISRVDFSGRITKEEAEKLEEYIIAERDKNNRIVATEYVSQKRGFFYFWQIQKRIHRTEYIYRRNGELYSHKNFLSRPTVQ